MLEEQQLGLMGKLMYKLSGGKINPMIGAAGVSAKSMAARVVQKKDKEKTQVTTLLMHAMGPNVPELSVVVIMLQGITRILSHNRSTLQQKSEEEKSSFDFLRS